jgi:hypothetical protein
MLLFGGLLKWQIGDVRPGCLVAGKLSAIEVSPGGLAACHESQTEMLNLFVLRLGRNG